MSSGTAWESGRLDGRQGPQKLLFGHMYEDPSLELAALRPGGRVLCIASAGCTAMALAPRHEVVAVDVNPVQLAYARERFGGAAARRGTADRFLSFLRALGPLAGWRRTVLRAFLDLEDPAEQLEVWRRRLDTRRFRRALGVLLSRRALRSVYAAPFLECLPQRPAEVFRQRLERCFGRHPNRQNPYARMLLLGEFPDPPPPPEARAIQAVHADAAGYLEQAAPGSFDGFTLSNILDGAGPDYRRRLAGAVARAAAPGAVVVLRSLAEPPAALASNRAAEDRALLWGIVDVRPAAREGGGSWSWLPWRAGTASSQDV